MRLLSHSLGQEDVATHRIYQEGDMWWGFVLYADFDQLLISWAPVRGAFPYLRMDEGERWRYCFPYPQSFCMLPDGQARWREVLEDPLAFITELVL